MIKQRYLLIILIASYTMFSTVVFAQENITYTYDALGRLIGTSHAGSINNGVSSSYCYDRAGNRRVVVVTGVGGVGPASCASAAFRGSGTDFNGDGIDDLLWRNTNGQLSDWLATSAGGFVSNDANALNTVATDWKVVGTGDFNGDGRADILFRNTSTGDLSDWLGTPTGGFVANDANAYVPVSLSFRVVGIGDFNGDGRSDILWRASDGTITDWLGLPTGGFQVNDGNASSPAASDWNVAGTGDFNGDGRSDIVWRNNNGEFSDWLGQPNGGFISNGSIAGARVDTNWKIVGVGDFNGDGRSDLLWRNVSGDLSNWLARPDAGFSDNDPNAYYHVGTDWQVVGTGDYNGDRHADILWRNASGSLSNWLGTANGSFANNDVNALNSVSTDWYVQGPSTF